MRSYKTEGIILKRVNFGEADRIITVFTKKYGKIKILAKGVRRITSRRSPNIELFNLVTLFVHRGKTFDILTEAITVDTYQNIRKNLELVGLAYYVCELVDGLCAEHQPHPRAYDLLVATLEKFGDTSEVAEWTPRRWREEAMSRFEQILLSELGFLPLNKSTDIDTTFYIEQLLERRLKTRRLLAKLA